MRAIREFSMSRKRMRGLVSPIIAFALVATAFAGCGELTGPTSPSTPINVTATVLPGGTSVTVTWTPSPQNDGVVSYNILRNGTRLVSKRTSSAIRSTTKPVISISEVSKWIYTSDGVGTAADKLPA